MNLLSLMVTAGTRLTISAASESGDFLMVSALMLSLTVAARWRFKSCVASAAFAACATTSTTSTLFCPSGWRGTSAVATLLGSTTTFSSRAP